jgi:phosphoribosylformylglycinamidine synthase
VPDDLNQVLRQLLADPNIASKEWVYRQYDQTIMTNTVVPPGADAAVLRIKGTRKGIALTTDCNARYCYLDPYQGGLQAVAEAARNLSCVGAEPLGITDCLNFGNPEKPEIFWQFREAVRGMCQACRFLEIPIVSGNVSFYNETNGEAIRPVPVVGMVGLLPDLAGRCVSQFQDPGDAILLLGLFRPELGASEYLSVIHGVEAGPVPVLDLAVEAGVQACCRSLVRSRVLKSAHDCAEGGLGVALAECCIAGGVGALIDDLPVLEEPRADQTLFGETQSAIVVTCAPARLPLVRKAAGEQGIPCLLLGSVGGNSLVIRHSGGRITIDLPVEEMERRWRECIPGLMG